MNNKQPWAGEELPDELGRSRGFATVCWRWACCERARGYA